MIKAHRDENRIIWAYKGLSRYDPTLSQYIVYKWYESLDKQSLLALDNLDKQSLLGSNFRWGPLPSSVLSCSGILKEVLPSNRLFFKVKEQGPWFFWF